MKRSPIVAMFMLAVVVIAVAACGDDDADDATPEGPPAATTAATEPTGIAELDAVIDAVLEGDVDTLLSMVRYTDVQCDDRTPAMSGPPCSSAGVPAGTVVETLPISISEGEYRLSDSVESFFRDEIARSDFRFFGLLEPDSHPFAGDASQWSTPDYAVVFEATRLRERWMAFHIADGGIVAVQGFGVGALDLPPDDDARWLVEPRR